MQALTIAAYIIRQCEEENSPINNLKLQKILYYIQMQHLQRYGLPAFDSPIEAWRHGPVVYHMRRKTPCFSNGDISHALISIKVR